MEGMVVNRWAICRILIQVMIERWNINLFGNKYVSPL